jgi:hypothetical protein
MENIHTFIFLIISIWTMLFLRKDLVTNPSLSNKFFVLIILIIINVLALIYKYYKKSKPLNTLNILRSAIFYAFVGTFGYIIFNDICASEKFGISKNINLQTIFYPIFITSLIGIFNEKLE